MSIVMTLPAFLPHSVIALTPMFTNVFSALTQHLLDVMIKLSAFTSKMRDCVYYFAVNVELHLLNRRIADSRRA
jgi:predicted glycosyltransferase involved in capsule biosynthesis